MKIQSILFSKRVVVAFWGSICLSGFHFGLLGCMPMYRANQIDGYQTQKRIVWQGNLTVSHGLDIIRLIYFGYDRNRDFQSLTDMAVCRGVDVLEYKCRFPNGDWDFKPLIIISDDNFDCYAERVLYDCDGDGTFEQVRDVSEQGILLEFVDQPHLKLLEAACLNYPNPK